MSFDRHDKGAGKISIIFWILVLGLLILAAFETIPQYYARYELGLAFDRTLEQVDVGMTDGEIREVISDSYKILKIVDHLSGEVEITRRYNDVNLYYEWSVDFGLPFTPMTYPYVFYVQR